MKEYGILNLFGDILGATSLFVILYLMIMLQYVFES